MSRVYFHLPDEEVELYGSERAWMGKLVTDVGMSVLDKFRFEKNVLPKVVGREFTDSYYRTGDVYTDHQRIWQALTTAMKVGDVDFQIGERQINAFDLLSNTAMLLGNDQIKLAAKLHATCEDFAYFEPEDCQWAANIMFEGLASGIFRPKAGWEDVIKLLEKAADGTEPVVTSYSVCESFPDSSVANWEPPECKRCDGTGEPQDDDEADGYNNCSACGGEEGRWDLWYSLKPELQWAKAVEGMRARTYNRRISPETLAIPFMYGETIFDLDKANEAVHDIGPKDHS